MKKFIIGFISVVALAYSGFAQSEKARLLDEFGNEPCEMILARSDNLLDKLKRNPTTLAYIIFYEGKHLQSVYNKKTKQNESKYLNPRYGEARNKAKAITFYLTKWRKMSKNRLILIDGGYRESYGVELWIAPQNSDPPKPSPDLERKDVKFRRGNAPGIADCQGFYSKI